MTRSRRRRVAVIATSALALVAVTAMPADAASDPATWGKTFCSSVQKWADKIQSGASDVESSVDSSTSPTQGRSILVSFLGDAADITSDFGDSMRKVGAPKVKNGAQIQSVIVEGIAGVEALLTSASTQAGALPTTDATTFKSAAQPLLAQLDAVSAPFEDAMTEVQTINGSEKLSKALRKIKACKNLTA